MTGNEPSVSGPVAVVSAALRLPGATSLEGYWENLLLGRDTLTRSPDNAAPRPDQYPLGVQGNARFVPTYGALASPMAFDPERFGMSKMEALLTDPQQRLLLETVDEALHAGGVTAVEGARTAVFAGTGDSTYDDVLRREMAGRAGVDDFAVELATARDYVAGKLAYRFDLHGPSATVLSACSTALMAVHLGSRALLTGEADVAVAAVAAVRFPLWTGYWAVPGAIGSSDGYCRPFDARASGSVPADGAGAIVLKRLDDALAAGDDVLAVIRGSAANNDGTKPGFAGVSSASQAAVIRAALDAAELVPDDIAYVESHGSATPIGDAVEWSALEHVFGRNRDSLVVGSVKGNVGHTREAAGIAGLLKAIQALRHGVVPRSGHFESLSPGLEVPGSPVRPVAIEAPLGESTRRAGVSAFGLGGVNCHLVLETAPERVSATSSGREVVLLSSHRPETLDAETAEVLRIASSRPSAVEDLVARSQARGHRHAYRRVVQLRGPTNSAALARSTARRPRRAEPVVMVFPGVGSEHVGMASGLSVVSEPFRQSLARSVDLAAGLGIDIAPAFVAQEPAKMPRALRRSGMGGLEDDLPMPGGLPTRHLALLAVQIAYVDLLAECGVQPAAVVGHSLGEWTAATVAGVLRREDTTRLVAERARLIERAPRGGTSAVAASPDAIRPHLVEHVVIAAHNSPQSCAISGPLEALEVVESRLQRDGVTVRRIGGTTAFHSPALLEAGERFAEVVRGVQSRDAQLPMASALTGEWIRPGEISPGYWRDQLAQPVRFADALSAVATRYQLLVEIGPGTVRPWATHVSSGLETVRTARTSYEENDDATVFEAALGRVWLQGRDVRWPRSQERPHSDEPTLVPALRRQIFDPVAPDSTNLSDEEATIEPFQDLADPPQHVYDPTTLMAVLAETWKELLGQDHVEPDDHFFELGGDSLLGRHLIAKVAEVTGTAVPSSVVFASGTLLGMSESIRTWLGQPNGQAS